MSDFVWARVGAWRDSERHVRTSTRGDKQSNKAAKMLVVSMRARWCFRRQNQLSDGFSIRIKINQCIQMVMRRDLHCGLSSGLLLLLAQPCRALSAHSFASIRNIQMSSPSLATSGKIRSNESAMSSDRVDQRSTGENGVTASSARYTNSNGHRFFEDNHGSIFSAPVGLPLVAAFYGEDLAHLPSSYPVKAFPPQIRTDEKGNSIFSEISSAKVFTELKEQDITKQLHDKIKLAFSDHFDVTTETLLQDGREYGEGLAFLPKCKEGNGAVTPLCVMEMGLSTDDWWKKFDQGTTCLDNMQEQREGPFCFDEPLLLAIITVDGEQAGTTHDFDFCMGVFLCTPREKDFRISLIWHKRQFAMEDASKSFGFLLRILDHFQTQRSKVYKEESEYFSSNCIKAGDMVLRVYDSRFWESEERPDLYLDPECSASIVGVVKTVLAIPPLGPAEAEKRSENNADTQHIDPFDINVLFTESPEKQIIVIATPFREGGHVARYPEDFLPIIDHLEKLHEAGYVHGDIRALNVAFPKTKGGPGYLIDFDFSGKAGKVEYPWNYGRYLPDGYRIGAPWRTIEKWHDWYALGWLIFYIHTFHAPLEAAERTSEKRHHYWLSLETDLSAEKILELKSFLSELQEKGCTVHASRDYQEWLDKLT